MLDKFKARKANLWQSMVYQARLSHGRSMPPATRGPGQPVNNGHSPSVVRVCPTRLQYPLVCPSWVLHSRIHFPCWPTPWFRLVTNSQHLEIYPCNCPASF